MSESDASLKKCYALLGATSLIQTKVMTDQTYKDLEETLNKVSEIINKDLLPIKALLESMFVSDRYPQVTVKSYDYFSQPSLSHYLAIDGPSMTRHFGISNFVMVYWDAPSNKFVLCKIPQSNLTKGVETYARSDRPTSYTRKIHGDGPKYSSQSVPTATRYFDVPSAGRSNKVNTSRRGKTDVKLTPHSIAPLERGKITVLLKNQHAEQANLLTSILESPDVEIKVAETPVVETKNEEVELKTEKVEEKVEEKKKQSALELASSADWSQ